MFEAFQEAFGAEWYKLINSPMWRAARSVLDRHAASRQIVNASPVEIASLGVVFAANIQGQMDILETMETKLPALPEGGPEEVQDDYQAETSDEPAPAAAQQKSPRKRKK